MNKQSVNQKRDMLEEYANEIKGNSFKQSVREFEICILESHPRVKKVLSVSAKYKIKNSKIIKTPIGSSLEGQIVSGNKLVITGEIQFRVVYIGEDLQEYELLTEYPFGEFIVMPANFTSNMLVTPKIYIEDIEVREEKGEYLFISAMLLFVAEIQ